MRLIEVPRHLTEALALEPQIEHLARDLAKCRDVLYLGRGTSYPIALEGALKLKEISYIHAEGYAAGELKHGPIALIDETMPVIVIAPYDGCSKRPSPTCRRSPRAAAADPGDRRQGREGAAGNRW
jgi:glucosamine--fructose-6-phosphate aminotransferase (isomerizing)